MWTSPLAERVTRLRVAIDARLESGHEGGVEQYIIGLAHGLSSPSSEEEEYLFLVYRGHDEWLRPFLGSNSRIIETPPPGRPPIPNRFRAWAGERMPWARQAWRRLDDRGMGGSVAIPVSDGTAERAGAHVVHFATQRGYLTALPTIYQPWDLQHLHLPQFFSPATRRWREATYRAFCDRARLIVVASEWARGDISRRYGIPPERFAVVPPPPPIHAYAGIAERDAGDVRQQYLVPNRFLIYPASTWEHKNHLRLLAAVAQLRDRHGMVVPIICTGRMTRHYRAIRRALGRHRLRSVIRFVGFVPPADLKVLYRLSDGLIFPSLFEGWGLPVVEAFALGVPVACAAVTSLPDLVGDAALLFDPTDVDDVAGAIGRLWTEPELRRGLAESGHRVAQNLDWAAAARIMRHHYRAVAARSAGEVPEESNVAPPSP